MHAGTGNTLCLVACLLCLILFPPTFAHAELQPATEADLPAMRAAGIPNPEVGMLWDASDPNIGRAAGETKQWLIKHTKLDESRILCLNPQFAQKLKNFMEQVPSGPPNITSAYRTIVEQQAAMRSGASRVKNACSGYHLYGLAADFNDNTREQTAWMRANAGSFGLRPIGAWDPNHFQNAQGRFGQCGQCSASGLGDTASGAGHYAASPSSGIADLLRKLFGGSGGQQPPPPPQTPQQPKQPPRDGQNATPQTLGTCAPQNYCANGNIYFRDSTCVDRLRERCEKGCSGASCNESRPLGFDVLSPTLSTSSTPLDALVLGQDRSTTTSAYDEILNVAGYTPQQADIDTTTLVLTIDGDDTVRIEPIPTSQLEAPSQSAPYGQIPGLQQTFTSPDLYESPVPLYAQRELIGLQRTLAAMRETLLNVLAYLRPFGRSYEHGFE